MRADHVVGPACETAHARLRTVHAASPLTTLEVEVAGSADRGFVLDPLTPRSLAARLALDDDFLAEKPLGLVLVDGLNASSAASDNDEARPEADRQAYGEQEARWDKEEGGNDLPKTDLHVHAETAGRLLRVIDRRRGAPRYSHQAAVERQMREAAPGMPRLLELNRLLREQADERRGGDYRALHEQPDYVEACFEELMEEEAANGCLIAEIRLGSIWVFVSHFLGCFRSAERRVQARHPWFHAEPIIAWGLDPPELTETVVRYTCALAPEGIAGVDLYPEYRRHSYPAIYRLAEKAAAAGLGITCHDGEFDPETLRLALEIPGLTRLGHATQAYRVPGMLEEMARRGIVVEVALTSNVVLGAVESYEAHPLRRFMDAGVRVTLCSDDPVTFATDIGREYAVAARLGFSREELLGFARTGVEASFTAAEKKAALMAGLPAPA